MREASPATPHRLLRLIWFDRKRGHYPGFGLPAVSFRAKRTFQSMFSGTRAPDPVVLSGVIAAQLPSRFWSSMITGR